MKLTHTHKDGHRRVTLTDCFGPLCTLETGDGPCLFLRVGDAEVPLTHDEARTLVGLLVAWVERGELPDA